MLKTAFVKAIRRGWGFPEGFTSAGAFAALRITACALTTTKSITLSGICTGLRQHE